MPHKPSVIIVDDEPEIVRLMTRLAKRTFPDATVHVAPTAEHAQALLPDVDPHDEVLIISDFNLGPGMNGTEFLRRTRETHPKARRILVTGYARQVLDADTEAAELSAFVEKPLDAPRFSRLMRDLLRPPSHGGGVF